MDPVSQMLWKLSQMLQISPQRSKTLPNTPKVPQTLQNTPKLSQTVQNFSNCSRTLPDTPNLSQILQNSPKRTKILPRLINDPPYVHTRPGAHAPEYAPEYIFAPDALKDFYMPDTHRHFLKGLESFQNL